MKFLKYFIIFFVISFLIINWKDVSWIFNYKFLSAAASDFFQTENISANNFKEKKAKFKKKGIKTAKFSYTSKENSIEIPKIGVYAPLVLSASSDEKEMQKDLKKGVAHFPNSVLPGEAGETVILGHSAPPNWPKINYDGIFNNLDKLKPGNKIILNFNHKEYIYRVRKKEIINKGENISKYLTNYNNMLILLTCWPPGRDYKRMSVQAALIK